MGTEPICGYRIADLGIQVRGDHARKGCLEGYTTTRTDAVKNVELKKVRELQPPTGPEAYRDPGARVYRDGDACIKYIGNVAEEPCRGHLRIWSRGNEAVLEYCGSGAITDKMVLHAIDLPHLLTTHDGFLLHASYIEHAGRAILFTAPSETGKSTQAKLWCDHAGAQLVNGDRAAVRIMDGNVFACGIPFSGSSPVHRNVSLPLAAIVYLSQAPENTIARLRGVRAFRRVWEGCTVNVWDRSDVEKATKTVSEVVSRIPVYHLACTPDHRAVELLKQTMEVEK